MSLSTHVAPHAWMHRNATTQRSGRSLVSEIAGAAMTIGIFAVVMVAIVAFRVFVYMPSVFHH